MSDSLSTSNFMDHYNSKANGCIIDRCLVAFIILTNFKILTSTTASLLEYCARSRIPFMNCLFATQKAFPVSIIIIQSFTS